MSKIPAQKQLWTVSASIAGIFGALAIGIAFQEDYESAAIVAGLVIPGAILALWGLAWIFRNNP